MAEPAPAASDQDLVLRNDTGAVARLVLNRPKARNALSMAMMAALDDALAGVAAAEGIHVVILTGAGPAFCAGHDLRELRSLEGDERRYRAVFEACSRLMLRIAALPQPVIAEVHGVATAAGCQLVAACDLAIAAETARFATPGVNIGLFCSTPAVALSRAVGRKAAMEMLLTGDMIDAARAREIGLVNRIVPEATLAAETAALAAGIAAKSRPVIALGKATFTRQIALPLADAYAAAGEAMACNMLARDAAEGIDAFLTKREPKWTNR
jgi:enoyl-CoA hydratase/carnithine racemase